ncbi:MAG: GntR family histidine utilization transcriptional repressor [Paracoccaceae bacterium]|jgi:GntR family histidine utilization transcriptional repressor
MPTARTNYQDIQSEVRRRIQSRAWIPGQIIPTEVELAAEFNCARATINRALRELAQTGLLERRRKLGTRVSLNPTRKATLDIPITRLEIEALGKTYRHKVIASHEIPAPEHVAARMNLASGAQVLHLKGLHLADDQPFLFEDRWVNLIAAPGILDAGLDKISANEWLVQNVPISSGEIAFGAEAATKDDAAALGVPIDAALFVVNRQTWMAVDGQKIAVTLVRLAYVPGYQMSTMI